MKNIYRYGAELNSHDLLKIVAISTMIVDHIGRFLYPGNAWFRIVGRMAAPQFFFLVGYSGSYRFKQDILLYGLALVAVDFLTDPGMTVFEQLAPLNILVSFVLIKGLMNTFDFAKLPTGFLILLLAVLMFVSLPTYFVIEYGSLGLCYAIGARLHRQGHGLRRFWICATVTVHFFFAMVLLLINNPDVPMSLLPFAVPLMLAVFAANLIIFMNYDFRVFKVEQKYVRTAAILISRYSLQIYFFHLSAFMIASYI